MRAKEGKIEIIPRGTNETIFHFDLADNIFKTDESFDISNIVTRVLIVGQDKPKGSGKKSKKKKAQGGSGEGHQKIEATIDGRIDLGIRQVIYERPNKKTLEETEKAAKKILEEQGQVKRKTVVESPDIQSYKCFKRNDECKNGYAADFGFWNHKCRLFFDDKFISSADT